MLAKKMQRNLYYKIWRQIVKPWQVSSISSDHFLGFIEQ